MATITLKIQVVPIEEVSRRFDRIQIFRTHQLDVAGAPVGFAEITAAGTRPVLFDNVALYSYADATAPDDTENVWYQVRYLNSTTGEVSPFNAPNQGTPNPALDIVSIEELKSNVFFGIDLTDDAGRPYPDSMFGHYIEAAISQVEAEFDIAILPTVITDEAHDYYRQDFEKFIYTVLHHHPIISVEQVRVVLPQGVRVLDFDKRSFNIDYAAGTLEIALGPGQVTLAQAAAFLPIIFGRQDYLPRSIRVDYTAGFSDKTYLGRRGLPGMLKKYISYLAAEGVLAIAGDLIVGAGIASQSISMDGLSQSVNTTSSATNSGYGSRILQYQKERNEIRKVMQQAFRGQGMTVV